MSIKYERNAIRFSLLFISSTELFLYIPPNTMLSSWWFGHFMIEICSPFYLSYSNVLCPHVPTYEHIMQSVLCNSFRRDWASCKVKKLPSGRKPPSCRPATKFETPTKIWSITNQVTRVTKRPLLKIYRWFWHWISMEPRRSLAFRLANENNLCSKTLTHSE